MSRKAKKTYKRINTEPQRNSVYYFPIQYGSVTVYCPVTFGSPLTESPTFFYEQNDRILNMS
jgi:hypothetical protein